MTTGRPLGVALAAVTVVVVGAIVYPPSTGARDAEPGGGDLASLIAGTPPGGTLELEARTYRGRVTITQPLTIQGRDGTVIDGGGRDSVITVNSPDVSLRHLEIRGSGNSLSHTNAAVLVKAKGFELSDSHLVDTLFGVYMKESPDARIINNRITSKDVAFTMRGDGIHVYQSPGTQVIGNVVKDARDVIAFFSPGTVVRDNVIENGRYGLHIMYSDDVRVSGNRMLRNSTGIYVMYAKGAIVDDNVLAFSNGPSAYGMTAKESDIPHVRRNRFVGNRVGVYMDSSPWTPGSTVRFENNVFAYNIAGLLLQPSVHGAEFTSNAFIDNRQQVAATTSGSLAGNVWSVGGVGNHWSDYAGYDSRGDGIGDIPYRAEGLYDSLTDSNPNLAFFAETPAARALDAAARAFPSLRPEPKAVDDAPLIAPPTLAPLEGMPIGSSRSALAGISLALLVAAGLLLRRGTRPLAGVTT